MQRARSMLRCSLFSLFEGKVMTKILSLQTFPPFFLQLVATIAPKGDKSAKPLQNLSISKDNLPNSCKFQNYCLLHNLYRFILAIGAQSFGYRRKVICLQANGSLVPCYSLLTWGMILVYSLCIPIKPYQNNIKEAYLRIGWCFVRFTILNVALHRYSVTVRNQMCQRIQENENESRNAVDNIRKTVNMFSTIGFVARCSVAACFGDQLS